MKVSIIDWIIKKLKRCIAIVEEGNTASQAIGSGKYVMWKGNLYTADTAISSGTTLAASGGSKNLTAVADGGYNDLNGKISTLNSNITNKLDKTGFQVYSANTTSYTFDAPRTIPGAYSFGLMFGATGADVNNSYLYIVFVNTSTNNNAVSFLPIKAHSSYTFTGSYNASTNKLTITSSGTCYGGMCFLWRGQA